MYSVTMNPSIETVAPQPVVGIRGHVHISQIGDRIGEAMGKLTTFVGPRMAGAPLARYHTWENDQGEMEVAVPVTEAIDGEGDIVGSTLPGGNAVVVMHVGPYDKLNETWTALGAWIKEQGLEPRAAPWEQYVSDCSVTPPEELETRIVWPVGAD